MQKQPAVYMMANKRNGTIYTGVTSNLIKRIYEHKNEVIKGFTTQYSCKILVFYTIFERMEDAIVEEKRIKAGSRKKKLVLIESMNPNWNDLYEYIA